MTEKVNLESELAKLKKEFVEFTTPPVELMPLTLPGCRMMASTCARCHHRGHRKDGNKNGVCCQLSPVLVFITVDWKNYMPNLKLKNARYCITFIRIQNFYNTFIINADSYNLQGKIVLDCHQNYIYMLCYYSNSVNLFL